MTVATNRVDTCPRCGNPVEPFATIVQHPYPTRYFYRHCDVLPWWNEGV